MESVRLGEGTEDKAIDAEGDIMSTGRCRDFTMSPSGSHSIRLVTTENERIHCDATYCILFLKKHCYSDFFNIDLYAFKSSLQIKKQLI